MSESVAGTGPVVQAMSGLAVEQRSRRHRSMAPGAPRDRYIWVAKRLFPTAAALLAVLLIGLPLTVTQEFSFLLSKDSAKRSNERMRIIAAVYRGSTAAGEPFSLRAGSGVQKSSSVPVVVLSNLSAEIERAAGPATVTAPGGEYNLRTNQALVRGPVVALGGNGYRVDGDSIRIDMNAGTVSSVEPVTGTLPMGSFRARGFAADIEGQTVVLTGRPHLHILPRGSPS
jgi:lipopolysaccharide export system protein LptC